MAKALTVRDASGKMTRAGFDMLSIDARQVFETILFSQGGTLFNEDITAPTFNAPAGRERAAAHDRPHPAPTRSRTSASPRRTATVNPLINGRAAMGMAHNNLWTQAQEADPDGARPARAVPHPG